MIRGHYISLLALALCSCTAHPRFTEPTPPTPSSTWKHCGKIDPLCDLPVNNKDLGAVELIDIALRNNPDTRATWENARAAAYQLQAVKSTLYPTVGADASYAITYQNFNGKGKNNESGAVIIADPDVVDADVVGATEGVEVGAFVSGNKETSQLIVSDLSASYLLFDFGARCATIESAREALQIANWSHCRLIQDVIMNVLTSYYAYLEVKALLEAQNDDLKDAEMNLKAAKELFDSGIRCQLDVLQSQSLLVNTQLVMEETRGFVQIELGNLANALGLPANTPLSVADLPQQLPQDRVESVDQLMEVAKCRRPDLAASLAEYRKKQADLCFAKADGLPFLAVDGELQRIDGLSSSVESGYVYSGTLSVEIPLFRGYYYENRKRAAKAKVCRAFADLQSKESDVLLEVWRSYYTFKTAVKTYKYSEEFLAFTEKTYQAAMGGYKEGTNSILDLLAAQKNLSRARAQKIQARTQWITSLAGIAHATGTL